MKRPHLQVLRLAATSVGLLLLLGTASAQPEKHNKDAQHQKKEQPPQAKTANPQLQPQGKRQPVPHYAQRGVWQQHRARSWQTEHRTWQQRGGYRGHRIPQDHFRVYFGQDHGFRVYRLPLEYYDGYSRFQYNGFWFGLVDPWPEYWDDNWYENDDVYINYSHDGYYLYNRRHPNVGIAINVYVN